MDGKKKPQNIENNLQPVICDLGIFFQWTDMITFLKGMFCEEIAQKLDCISRTGATAPHNLSSLEPKETRLSV